MRADVDSTSTGVEQQSNSTPKPRTCQWPGCDRPNGRGWACEEHRTVYGRAAALRRKHRQRNAGAFAVGRAVSRGNVALDHRYDGREQCRG